MHSPTSTAVDTHIRACNGSGIIGAGQRIEYKQVCLFVVCLRLFREQSIDLLPLPRLLLLRLQIAVNEENERRIPLLSGQGTHERASTHTH